MAAHFLAGGRLNGRWSDSFPAKLATRLGIRVSLRVLECIIFATTLCSTVLLSKFSIEQSGVRQCFGFFGGVISCAFGTLGLRKRVEGESCVGETIFRGR